MLHAAAKLHGLAYAVCKGTFLGGCMKEGGLGDSLAAVQQRSDDSFQFAEMGRFRQYCIPV